ncbi:MAG: Na+/H+ antiporter [Chitinophagaceae bacterium]
MLQDNLLLVIALLMGASLLSILSKKLNISYPIFLVLAGLAIGIIPGIPHVSLDPDFVFVIFLPPLLYSAAWNTSWNDFWFYKRSIGLLAFGLVIFTAGAVAVVANKIIPGFSLPLGFLLGGIISPPDAIAATSVLQNLKVSRRVITILEGESLVNDASSLIVFRFALATILTGQFSLWKAEVSFFEVAIMGIIIGLAISHIIYAVHRFLPTTPSIDTAISLITPYLLYLAAEHFHYSGVLSVVSGGLFLSFRSHDIFSYGSRLQSKSVWDTLVFLLNGVVFILIGLQLPFIVEGLGGYSLKDAIWYAVIISIVTIVVRLLWIFPAAYLPRRLSHRIRKRESDPGWKQVLVVGWSGMRGVVSLASGLSIPLMANGADFPHRNLILFITFTAILCTLVLQGISLPWLIRILKIEVQENEETQELSLRLKLAEIALDYMDEKYTEESATVEPFRRLKERYERMAENANKQLSQTEEKDAGVASYIPRYREMLLGLVDVRRTELERMRRNKEYNDELIRNKEYELDLEEARLRR